MKCTTHSNEYCKTCNNSGNLPGLLPATVVDQINTAWDSAYGTDIDATDPSDWAELAARHRTLAKAYHAVLNAAPADSVLIKLAISAEGGQRRLAKFWQQNAEQEITRNDTR